MMVFFLARRAASLYNQRFMLRTSSFWFQYLTTIPNKDDGHGTASVPPSEYSTTLHLSPFLSNFDHPSSGYNIKLVDGDAWGVSSGVAQAWPGRQSERSAATAFAHHGIDEPVDCNPSHLEVEVEDDMDFEDIDNMRVHGNLFYKLERSSKEFEEYNLEFHHKKSSKKKDDNKKEKAKEVTKAKAHIATRSRIVMPRLDEIKDVSPENKRQRTPTFNQLTVAHSIFKDIKFDLASTKNKTTCAAVGTILAQRALADDIHDVIY
ncbi:hypothetical protein PIB30_027428 [Stylosanthes scabra]|uniref:Uncharacterized protein n=1 Tax=Stylosanthes scabra TaxID=79078 RepID=A0ABU6WDR1_9FABA|nr:hypothetical protein [Stylosanthes scabra]